MKNEKKYAIENVNGIDVVRFRHFVETGLTEHFYTTRNTGVSSGAYSSLNPGATTDDSPENVIKNRMLIEKAAGYYPKETIRLEHGCAVYKISSPICGPEIPVADAVITDVPEIPLVILYADCVPVFILDKETPAIALIHAGWKGTLLNIAGKTVAAMKENYGTKPDNCLAAIAPSIGKCCFETDEDVANLFSNSFKNEFPSKYLQDLQGCISKNNKKAKYNIDLWGINTSHLLQAGIPIENIAATDLCTSCNSDMFYSYRRDKKITGRMAAVFVLKKQ